MGLVESLRDSQLGAFAVERRPQPMDEIERKERRVARHRDDELAAGTGEARVQTGKRPRKTADGILDHGLAERTVAVEILVRVDQHVADLRRQPREHVRDHGCSGQIDQSLVDATHAPALAARQHDAGDVSIGDRHRAPASGHGIQPTCSSKDAWRSGLLMTATP